MAKKKILMWQTTGTVKCFRVVLVGLSSCPISLETPTLEYVLLVSMVDRIRSKISVSLFSSFKHGENRELLSSSFLTKDGLQGCGGVLVKWASAHLVGGHYARKTSFAAMNPHRQ